MRRICVPFVYLKHSSSDDVYTQRSSASGANRSPHRLQVQGGAKLQPIDHLEPTPDHLKPAPTHFNLVAIPASRLGEVAQLSLAATSRQ